MTALPDLDTGAIGPAKLHEALLAARLTMDLEAEKAKAIVALEGQKEDIARAKARLDRRLAERKEDSDASVAAETAERTKELELRGLYHQKITEVVAGAIDRARDSAKFVQTAAAALITVYVALLGLVFSAKDRPLPLRGAYAAAYLGLAIALAVAYLAFLKPTPAVDGYEPKETIAETQLARTAAFIDWINSGVANRRGALRCSVVAFGIGIAFIPAPFVGATGGTAATATAETTPPSIPRAVPAPIADDATRLFKHQVDTYLSAVAEQRAGAGTDEKPVTSCTGYGDIPHACAWTTEKGVERSFRRLAALSLLVVLGIPLLFAIYEKRNWHQT